MKRGKLKQTGHLLAAILIMIHGFASFEDKDFKAAAGYLGVAVLALIVAGLHKFINRTFSQADVAFLLLESVTLFYSGWEYREEGRFALSYFIIAAAIGYFIWAFFSLIFKDDHRGHSSSQGKRKKQRHSSSSPTHEV